MRIATWNVNSLRARLDKVFWWLDRAEPDVLLLQETKLADANQPSDEFSRRGYELAHHGEGRWNGVAIASRVGISNVITNFGDPPARAEASGEGDHQPLAEARMISALCEGVRVTSLYAPNGRELDSLFYEAKLTWFERLASWLKENHAPSDPVLIGGDFNIAPTDEDVWDAHACQGGTHVSPRERAVYRSLLDWGLVDAYRLHHPEPNRYTWWDYRGGAFHLNRGMRIDHLLVTRTLADRVVWSEIDREARKGKPTPSDHTPLVLDLDRPGKALDAGWSSADARIAARRGE